jgi:hypothetical protein
MLTKIDLMNNRTSIEVTDAKMIIDNFHTIEFKDGESYIALEISEDNYNELGQKMFPQGLIPDDFSMKIIMLNQLIEELEYIEDRENKGFYLKKVSYDEETDNIYFDCEEE